MLKAARPARNALFAESCVPPLQSGDYVISVTQNSATLGDSATATQAFSIAGPRFSLPEAEVNVLYPPAGMRGGFGHTLPHIVLNRKTLPWERALSKEMEGALRTSQAAPSFQPPWFCLLVLWEEEILAEQEGTVAEMVDTAKDGIYCPALHLNAREKEQPCRYLDLPAGLFRELIPPVQDLVYLCHARKTDPAPKADRNDAQDEWNAVLVANRLPQASDAGAKNKVYLVSLEGFGAYDSDPEIDQHSHVRMVVLHSWEFFAVTEKYHFMELAQNLAVAPLAPSGEDAVSQNGYLPLVHRLRNGEPTVSLYRGPLAPCAQKPRAQSVPSADSLYRYDPEYGVFDVSYAVAWQTGRQIALGNQTIAMKLIKLRRANYQSLHKARLAGFLRQNFAPSPAGAPADSEQPAIGQTLLQFLNESLEDVL